MMFKLRERARRRVLGHFFLWYLGSAGPESQTNEDERNCLARHAAGRKRLVEIGVWQGVTTCRLRRTMDEDGLLLAVDPFLPGRLGFSAARIIALREVQRIRNGTVRWMRHTGADAGRHYLTQEALPIDFIFFDGDHTYEGLRGDWETWAPLVAPHGVVAIHDSRSSATRQIDDAGSAIFTRDVVLHDPRFELIETVDTLTVVRRRAV
jgi:predicted O-methyltransferase YrrM